MDVKLYVRDVAIIILLSFFGGFIGGFVLGVARINEPEVMTLVIAVISIVTTIAGFWIVGCLSKKSAMQRFNYLGYVGISVWLVGLTNIAVGLSNITQWMLSSIFILICLAIGGGLSLLTCKAKIEETIN
jgi:hypothetical protein